MNSATQITSADEVPEETTFLFRVTPVDDDEEKEAILIRDDEGIIGWLNYCQHYTHIKLDKGSGAELRDGEVVCTNHGAYFEVDSGRCTFGPCEGAFLNEVDVAVDDGDVYLTDDDYEFVGTGEIETDADDLGSKSNYKF